VRVVPGAVAVEAAPVERNGVLSVGHRESWDLRDFQKHAHSVGSLGAGHAAVEVLLLV
jgi:hypothetical protein